jgi:MOSC domain-containing protein YiiM
MNGIIVQVNTSPGGVPKRPVLLGTLTRTGFDTDAFAHPRIHGGPDQAVLLIANETIEGLAALGYPVYPGALGENLTTSGLNPKHWRSGQQFRVGSARIELTKPRAPCRTLDAYRSVRDSVPIQNLIYDAGVKRGNTSAEHWGRSGFYARVLQEGEVMAGSVIALESELA